MNTYHVISHTHWDREWYLTFQQFRLKLVHLIDRLLDILEKDPDFQYFMLDGQTIVLDDYLQIRPEMEEILRQHIQAGRIVIGPWHILPDMFLVSPEAHVRNLLQGARTTAKFGPRMPVGYVPDPFGHPAQTPQILKGFDLEAAALWRGVSDYPPELWWKAPDGTKILLAFLRNSYSNGANLPAHNAEQFSKAIGVVGKSLADLSAVNDQLIMMGTDHMEPSPFTSRAIAHATETLEDVHVIHSTLGNYVRTIAAQIEQLEESIPTITGELRSCDRSHLLPGVLSARMWIKQRNHKSQTLLEKWAEPFSTFAAHLVEDPSKIDPWSSEALASNYIHNAAPILRQAWKYVLENHPHDSICGCSIDQVHDEMEPRFDQADQISEEITQQSLQKLARAVNTQLENAFTAVVLFNPFGFDHHDLVEVELNVPEEIEKFELFDAENNVIPHEFIGSSNTEFANVVLKKENLRDMIGAISDGSVAGMAITHVTVTREDETVTLFAVLSDDGVPNVSEWRQAEADLVKHEADPTVTQVRVIARSPRSSQIRFVSPSIPAFGWTTVWARKVEAPPAPPAAEISPLMKPFLPLAMRFAQSEFGGKLMEKLSGSGPKPPYIIENEYFLVEVDPGDGTLTVSDKRNQVVYSGLHRFVDGGDAGDEYNYSPPAEDGFYTANLKSVQVQQEGVIAALDIEYVLTVPDQLTGNRQARSEKKLKIPVSSRISLLPGVPRIDIHTEIDNPAKDHRLRVHFPVPFAVQEAEYDGHFEVVQRPVGIPEYDESWVEEPRPEVPQRAFTNIVNGKLGLMIANRGLPEVEVLQVGDNAHSEIALTLLRSVGWLSRDDMSTRRGHAGPGLATPGAQCLGKWEYDYAIIPHSNNFNAACQLAYGFETELKAVDSGLHSGETPIQGSFIAHSPETFIISAVKEAEDGTGWVLRGYNITADPIELSLRPIRGFGKVSLANMAEVEQESLTPEADGGVKLNVPGHRVITLKFMS